MDLIALGVVFVLGILCAVFKDRLTTVQRYALALVFAVIGVWALLHGLSLGDH